MFAKEGTRDVICFNSYSIVFSLLSLLCIPTNAGISLIFFYRSQTQQLFGQVGPGLKRGDFWGDYIIVLLSFEKDVIFCMSEMHFCTFEMAPKL